MARVRCGALLDAWFRHTEKLIGIRICNYCSRGESGDVDPRASEGVCTRSGLPQIGMLYGIRFSATSAAASTASSRIFGFLAMNSLLKLYADASHLRLERLLGGALSQSANVTQKPVRPRESTVATHPHSNRLC